MKYNGAIRGCIGREEYQQIAKIYIFFQVYTQVHNRNNSITI